MSARFWMIVVGTIGLFCVPAQGSIDEINAFVDAWHDAAARADDDAYFGAMTEDCVFIGTDATERWTRDQLRSWSEQFFERESAWVFVPKQRNITLSAVNDFAWFDERLDSPHMGEVRGTGVVTKTNDGWKILHYTLSFPVPNALADVVVEQIAEHQKTVPAREATVVSVTGKVTYSDGSTDQTKNVEVGMVLDEDDVLYTTLRAAVQLRIEPGLVATIDRLGKVRVGGLIDHARLARFQANEAKMIDFAEYGRVRVQQLPEAHNEVPADDSPAMIENVRLGRWRATIESPGGNVPFDLLFEEGAEGELTAYYKNADEEIPVPIVKWHDGLLHLEMDQFESLIVFQLQDDGVTMYGQYSKRKGGFKWDRLAMAATFGEDPRFERHTPEQLVMEPAFTPIKGKWRVVFEDDPDDPAIGVFESINAGPQVYGTFLTTTGDYRYLEGTYEHGRLRLSVFDGAHCFLFDAQVDEHGTMRGFFQSGEHYHTEFTATRSPDEKLGDPFALTKWVGGDDLGKFSYPDPDGVEWSMDDERFAGRARIIQVMGSWCPNCKDETSYLIELHNRYAADGLSILGVSYEITGDEDRNAEIVKTFIERMGVPYPVLIAGGSDGANKRKAQKAVGFLDKVLSYPTTVFIDGAGKVRAVHTGFMGPATGEEHLKLRASFEGLIEEMLGE